MAAVRTKVEELPESKVRLEIEVGDDDLQHAIEHAAQDLAGELRIPGFRKGKAPLRVVAARVGRETLMGEAVRSHIGGWFWNAAAQTGVQPVSQPDVEFDLPGEGEAFRFTATVAVPPKPEVADWTALEVGAAEPEVPAEAVDAEVERLRATVAELTTADRPARAGDTLVVDVEGDKGTQRDYVLELGRGHLVQEVEAALLGAGSGDRKNVDFELADGTTGKVEIAVKEVKESVLPPLDDDLARAASEFDTLAELRADIEERLREQLAGELEAKFREDATDALVAATPIATVEPLVERRTAEILSGLLRSLESRGIAADAYLAMTGQTQEALVGRLRAEAEQSVKREVVLDAAAEKLGIETSDDEVEELIREQADDVGEDAEEALALMREHGGFEKLKADLRLKKALDEIVSGVKRIPVDLASARQKLWTPEKEKGDREAKIWTPGSEEVR